MHAAGPRPTVKMNPERLLGCMRFQTLEDLRKIAQLLAESDFDRVDCRWEPSGTLFVLKTARPPAQPLKGAGLFRKSRRDWIQCRLTFSGVKEVSIWEEYSVKPAGDGLLEVEPAGAGFHIHLSSAHGLRVDLRSDHLEGSLEDGVE